MNKTLVQLCVLCIASLYFVFSELFGWPYAEVIVGTLVIFATFLEFLDVLSKKQYDGKMVVSYGDEGQQVFTLELDEYPEDLKNRESISFEVVSPLEE